MLLLCKWGWKTGWQEPACSKSAHCAEQRQPTLMRSLTAWSGRRIQLAVFPCCPPPTLSGQVFEGWAYWHALGVTQHAQLREAALGLLRQVSGHSVCWYCKVWYSCTDMCAPHLFWLPSC